MNIWEERGIGISVTESYVCIFRSPGIPVIWLDPLKLETQGNLGLSGWSSIYGFLRCIRRHTARASFLGSERDVAITTGSGTGSVT